MVWYNLYNLKSNNENETKNQTSTTHKIICFTQNYMFDRNIFDTKILFSTSAKLHA